MLTLAFMFSINEIVKFDILLLDEIDSNLDETKIANLNNLLRNLKSQIFQISHRKSSLCGDKYFHVNSDIITEQSKEEAESRFI